MTSNWLRASEFLLWVAVVSATLIGVSAVFSFAVGGGLLTLKRVLFVVGFLLFGAGSIGIQPKSPRRETKLFTTDTDSEYGFETRIQHLPPLRGTVVPFRKRVGRDTKVLATSLVVLAVSLLLEVGFGVTPSTP